MQSIAAKVKRWLLRDNCDTRPFEEAVQEQRIQAQRLRTAIRNQDMRERERLKREKDN